MTNPPVKFRRTRGMLPLPTPVRCGSLNGLRRFLNVPPLGDGDDGDDAGWILTVSWLIAAFRATLEEINEATVLVHILDVTHDNATEQAATFRDGAAQAFGDLEHLLAGWVP